MSEAENEAGTEEQGENPNLRHLREKAEQADAARAAEAQLRKEVAFLKAGIDTDSKLGGLLFKTYEGDLSDLDSLKKEATEIGALKAEEPVAETPAEDSEPTGSDQRRQLADGAPADTGEKLHPWTEAQKVYDRAMSDGETWEESAGLALNSLANAAMRGDPRAIVQQKQTARG